jgi:hypothetical protein
MTTFKRLPLHGNKLFKRTYTLDGVRFLDFKRLKKAVDEASNLLDASVDLCSGYEEEPEISIYGYVPATEEEVAHFERKYEYSQRAQYEFLKKVFEAKP